MVFISLGIRMLVNVEALNMVESVGNVVRHRTVPMVIRKPTGEYIMRWVPAISGECLAHAYQSYLAELATKRNINVCYWCRKNEFIKHFDLKFYQATSGSISYSKEEEELFKYIGLRPEQININIIKDIEEKIVKSCVVEDVGGFLVVQGPTKRTSRFYVSYAIPTYDTVEKGVVALDHQFMVRHAPEAEVRRSEIEKKIKEAEKKPKKSKEVERPPPPAQAPYYPQIGSSLYAWIFNIELSGIGVSSISGEKVLEDTELRERKKVALDSLAEMLDNRIFGAKLTRFTPFIDYEVILATISKGIRFTVSSPSLTLEQFIKETVERLEKARKETKSEIKAVIWCKDEITEKSVKKLVSKSLKDGNIEVLRTSSVRDLIEKIKEVADLTK